MRIGIHTGKIIGGVIGIDVIRFDIYGEDVVIANKMESKGEKNQINISHTTKDLLEKNYNEFNYEFNKTNEISGNKIDSYFITKKWSIK